MNAMILISIFRYVHNDYDVIYYRAVGSEVAAQLMCAAGGLEQLSKVPSCNIQLLGKKRKAAGVMMGAGAGGGERTANGNGSGFKGFISSCNLVTSTPPVLQAKAIRMVGAKCALLAR